MKRIIAGFTALLAALAALTDPGGASPAAQGFNPQSVTLTEVAGTELKELVNEPLHFTDSSGVVWTAPEGTLTDGASVPRLALWLTDGRFDSAFLKAAIIHDAYCQTDNADRTPEQYRTRRWQDVH